MRDSAILAVDEDSFAFYLAVLDHPPSGDGYELLMSAPLPWGIDTISQRNSKEA